MSEEASSTFSPLSTACVKALTDKSYDKRKFAALEIEKMVKDFSQNENLTQIERLVNVLSQEFCLSTNSNAKKGGLIGLAALMIALKTPDTCKQINGHNPATHIDTTSQDNRYSVLINVIKPILTCVLDPDIKVRYFACESLYNVIKVARSSIRPIFNDIFDCLAKIIADPDSSVRSGAILLDRLLRDIVSEDQDFDLASFVPRLRECIYTKNPFARMFIISWIKLLDSVPDSELIIHLPQLLDGLFTCLHDSTEEIKASTLSVLSEFLNEIVTRPNSKIELPSMINILIIHSQADKEELVRYTAIVWLREFIGLMDESDANLVTFTPGILTAILPCLAFHTSLPIESILIESDEAINQAQSHNHSFHLHPSNTMNANICETATTVNIQLQEKVTNMLSLKKSDPSGEASPHDDLESIIEVLSREMRNIEHPTIKLAILEWFRKLKHANVPDMPIEPKFFQVLLDTLSDRSDEVVKMTLSVLTDIFCSIEDNNAITLKEDIPAQKPVKEETDKKKTTFSKFHHRSHDKTSPTHVSHTSPVAHDIKVSSCGTFDTTNFNRFILALVERFKKEETVFNERGSFIIIHLCYILDSEHIYRSFATILKDEKKDLKFAYNMVQKLNEILLTSQELFKLRQRLRSISSTDSESGPASLFFSLYQAWCHSPIATLSLCLLTGNHRHASDLIMVISNMDVTLDLLVEIDKLIQLIESPIFAFIRVQLLDNNYYLLRSLYGLLMILPPSEAFRKLRNRLKCVSSLSRPSHPHSPQPYSSKVSSARTTHQPGDSKKGEKMTNSPVDAEVLTRHFKSIQELHSTRSMSEI